MKLIKQEVDATRELDHKHIVKVHEFSESTTWYKKSGKEVPVAYIAQEAVLGGELFDHVFNAGAFSEPICRYYFKQILMGLSYLHNKGYCHRDLKPENILLDSNFDVKIVDFGFSCPI